MSAHIDQKTLRELAKLDAIHQRLATQVPRADTALLKARSRSITLHARQTTNNNNLRDLLRSSDPRGQRVRIVRGDAVGLATRSGDDWLIRRFERNLSDELGVVLDYHTVVHRLRHDRFVLIIEIGDERYAIDPSDCELEWITNQP